MPFQPDHKADLTGPFWSAAAQNRLQLPRCKPCGKFVWYPQERCPHCGGQLNWQPVSGRGTLAAYSVVSRPLLPDYTPWVPYVPALIAIEEDPSVRIVSQIVDCRPQALRCGLPVEVVYRELAQRDAEAYVAPLFRPRG